LSEICALEKVEVGPGAMDRLLEISGGDLRKSITMLQSLACSGQMINIKDIDEISGQIPDAMVNSLVNAANSTNATEVIFGLFVDYPNFSSFN
jgi:DNA polymerase III delta prime subunit